MYFGLPMLLNHAQPRSFLVTGPPAATAADVTVFVAAAAAATEGALMVAIRAGAMFSQASESTQATAGDGHKSSHHYKSTKPPSQCGRFLIVKTLLLCQLCLVARRPGRVC